jgi:hypothetical protein
MGFKIKFLARPEGEGCICNTPTTDNAVQNLYLKAYSRLMKQVTYKVMV